MSEQRNAAPVKQPKLPSIPGTRVSAQNSQLLVSSGVPLLDILLGGGLPVGSVVLVEEDEHNVYSNVLLRYFISQTVTLHHSLLFSSTVKTLAGIMGQLPSPTDSGLSKDQGAGEPMQGKDDRMSIAWRYQHKPNIEQAMHCAAAPGYSNNFDLSKTISKENIDEEKLAEIRLPETDSDFYSHLLQQISKFVDENGFCARAKGGAAQNVLKIVLQSYPSPVFGDWYVCQFPWFLYMLRSVLRSSYAVCMVSIPSIVTRSDIVIRRRLHHLADIVYRVESFRGGDNKNPVYKEYHGLFHLIKLARLNSICVPLPDTLDWAYKLKKRKFVLERLHLPPEISDTVHREQDDLEDKQPAATANKAAGRVGIKLLDF